MNKESVKVTFKGGEVLHVQPGTSLLEISKMVEIEEDTLILAGILNGKLKELFETVEDDCTVSFIDLTHVDGLRIYQRSLSLILLRAIFEVVGRKDVKKVSLNHSINKALYCDIVTSKVISEELIQQIEDRMKEIVEADEPIKKQTVSLDKGLELFEKDKMYDKVELFKYRRISTVNLYTLGWFTDYFYGFMAPSTSYLKWFKLIPYDDGFVLQYPTKKKPHHLIEYKPFNKLFNVFKESKQWSNILNVNTVGALNDNISCGEIRDLIQVSEALHEKKLAEIADKIIDQGGAKVILIAGPSSSGKTTTAHRLSIQLRVNGVRPHPISIDDYFVNREFTPLDEDGKYDFESLYAIDIEKFNEDIMDLLNGKRVEIPSFNFKTGKREYKGNFVELGDNDVLVAEGIHGLNDKLTKDIPKELKYKIYVSALTQLNIDDHNRIPTTDVRLLRRIVRDNQYRGIDASRTIEMWPSVRRGEERNIFPYQEGADVMFNSSHIYELAVLKQYAEPLLFNITKDQPEFFEARRLIKFLDYFLGVSSEDVPTHSIIREFIGGSIFRS